MKKRYHWIAICTIFLSACAPAQNISLPQTTNLTPLISEATPIVNGVPVKDPLQKLKDSFFDGNENALKELYSQTPLDEMNHRNLLELARFHENEPNPFSATNPYKPEIFYSESSNLFPHKEILTLVTKSFQTNQSLEALNAQVVAPNSDWAAIRSIPNYQDYSLYFREYESPLGIYKLDLDNDGVQEFLVFFPGGSMGNIFWQILELDKDGQITNIHEGQGMRNVTLYFYIEHYFFTSNIVDFNDKHFLGLSVYALAQDGLAYRANVYYDRMGSEIVLHDTLVEQEHSFYLYGETDRFIDLYKGFSNEPLGNGTVPPENIRSLLNNYATGTETFGKMDFNNDGVDDWTNAYLFFPSNSSIYFCDYTFVDGKTNQILHFPNRDDSSPYQLCRIIPYYQFHKNYFVLVYNGYGNYIFNLIEINGTEPIVLERFLISAKNRILVDACSEKDQIFANDW